MISMFFGMKWLSYWLMVLFGRLVSVRISIGC